MKGMTIGLYILVAVIVVAVVGFIVYKIRSK
jgi:hypothetical protein